MLDRRSFLSYIPAAATTFGAMVGMAPASDATASQGQQGISAIETLMRGHGLLSRAMIIYGVIKDRIVKGEETDPSLILNTASVFHNYLEGFHEMAEEKYIFGPMEKNNVCFAAIQELKIQHGAGYELTQRITNMANEGKINSNLAAYFDDFKKMYRHHTAYEDTVVFPAFEAMEKRNDLAELAAGFDLDEKRVLGHHGFDDFLKQIANVEIKLGIYDLYTSTPKLQKLD